MRILVDLFLISWWRECVLIVQLPLYKNRLCEKIGLIGIVKFNLKITVLCITSTLTKYLRSKEAIVFGANLFKTKEGRAK